jgi:hypothetical protein
MFSEIMMILMASCAIVWPLMFLPFVFLGCKIHVIKEESVITTVSKKIIPHSFMIEGEYNPRGFFGCRDYIGYVHMTTGTHGNITEIYLLSTPKIFADLKRNTEIGPTSRTVQICYTFGIYYNIGVGNREIEIDTDFAPTLSQKEIIDAIIGLRTSKYKKVVSVISGNSGSGKSTIGLLLAAELGGTLCTDFCPSTPGHSLTDLYTKVNPTKESPLIIELSEIDGLLKGLEEGLRGHRDIPTLVTNKSTWNAFMDSLQYYFPHLIVIMTTNVELDTIMAIDPSYLRKGRVDHSAVLDTTDSPSMEESWTVIE